MITNHDAKNDLLFLDFWIFTKDLEQTIYKLRNLGIVLVGFSILDSSHSRSLENVENYIIVATRAGFYDYSDKKSSLVSQKIAST